jgi:hypothetical protein
MVNQQASRKQLQAMAVFLESKKVQEKSLVLNIIIRSIRIIVT